MAESKNLRFLLKIDEHKDTASIYVLYQRPVLHIRTIKTRRWWKVSQ